MSGNGSLKKQDSLTDEQQTIINQKTAKIERLQTDITNLSKPLLGVDDTKDNNKNNWSKNIATPSVLSVFQDNSSWNKFTLKSDSPLLKQQSSYQERLQEVNGSSWNKMKDVLNTASDILEGDDHVSENEIATTKLNYRDMKTYGNMPMEDDVIVVNCNHCKRPILPSSFKEHMEKCGNKNDKETKKNGNKDNINGSSNNSNSNSNSNSNNNPKKRIAAQTFFSDNDDDDDDDDDDHMGTTKQKDSTKDSSTTVKKKKKSVKVNNSNNNNSSLTTNKENGTATTTTSTSTNSEDTTNSTNTKRPPPNNNDSNKNNDTTTTTTTNTTDNNNTSEKMDNKKKTKKEKSKSKSAKQKAPLDLDKQCGVIQIPNGTPCTRSLTCKSHSMGAKRAVAGRSQPYDVLLAAYQKKAIGRPQSGASGTGNNKNVKIKKPSSSSSTTPSTSNNNISGANGNSGSTSDNVIQSTSSSTSNATNNNNSSSSNQTNNQNNNQNNEDYFDSDEEVENIMQALRSNHPAPLAQKPYFYVKRKRQCYRLRDILLEAITPKEKESTSTHPIQDTTSNNSNNNLYQNNNSKTNTPYSSTFQASSSSTSIHRQLQQQQQLALLSPTSNNMNYSGIYMDSMSPTSPATSIASTYSIR